MLKGFGLLVSEQSTMEKEGVCLHIESVKGPKVRKVKIIIEKHHLKSGNEFSGKNNIQRRVASIEPYFVVNLR